MNRSSRPSGMPTPRPTARSWLVWGLGMIVTVGVHVAWTISVTVLLGPVDPEVRLLMIVLAPIVKGALEPWVEVPHSFDVLL